MTLFNCGAALIRIIYALVYNILRLDEQLYVGDRGCVTGRIFSLEFPVLPWILNPSTAATTVTISWPPNTCIVERLVALG
ncbi:hypothetical protein E2C01_031227 [Portunus trituberculatus]|uniref:Uncharacterized protein n=1 Tax=Portunus trituberculatus TaxID=210409 RepID=A0A5B7EX41_PORTR|nr:hypothetical protein [Portunus trituberculatus]